MSYPIGRNIRLLRIYRKLSQSELARAGISRHIISRIETGRRGWITNLELAKIRNGLRLSGIGDIFHPQEFIERLTNTR